MLGRFEIPSVESTRKKRAWTSYTSRPPRNSFVIFYDLIEDADGHGTTFATVLHIGKLQPTHIRDKYIVDDEERRMIEKGFEQYRAKPKQLASREDVAAYFGD